MGENFRRLREDLEGVRTQRFRKDEELNVKDEIKLIINRIIEDAKDLRQLTTKEIKKEIKRKVGGTNLEEYEGYIKQCIKEAARKRDFEV